MHGRNEEGQSARLDGSAAIGGWYGRRPAVHISVDDHDRLDRATLDFMSSVVTLPREAEICARFQSLIELFGFASVACFQVPDPGQLFENCIYMCTRPPGWVERYLAEDYVGIDPIVHEVFHTARPFRWSQVLSRGELTAAQQRIHTERRGFGLTEGLVIPLYERKGYAAMVNLAGDVETTPRALDLLTSASVQLHSRLITLGRERMLPDDLLTGREMECLNWAADGKTDWEIGLILKISAKTVNYHIENVKRKFGVPTRVQAIVAAFRYGKIG